MELPFPKKGKARLVLEAPARLYAAVNVWAGACMILKLGGDLSALLNLHIFAPVACKNLTLAIFCSIILVYHIYFMEDFYSGGI